jgi:hypothetical protein
MFKESEKLQKLVEKKDVEAVIRAADSSCLSDASNSEDYGNEEDISGRKIFEDGFKLGVKAGSLDTFVFVLYDEESGSKQLVFFIGTEAMVRKKLFGLPKAQYTPEFRESLRQLHEEDE